MARNTGSDSFRYAVLGRSAKLPRDIFADATAFNGAISGSDNRTNRYFNTASSAGIGVYLTHEERRRAAAKRAVEDLALIEATQADEQEPPTPLFNRIVNTAEALASYLIGPSLLRQFNTGTAITFTPSGNNTPFNAAAAPSLTSPIALTTGLGAPNNASGASGNTSAPSSNIS